MVVDILSWISILLGSFFMLTSGVGIIRMPDFFSRLHPVSVGDAAGMIFILLGLGLQVGFSLVAVKVFLLACVLLITGATASHAVAKAALFHGVKPKGKAAKW